MKRTYAAMKESDDATDICTVCKRNAFVICATCEAYGMRDSCWVSWDIVNGLRHCHCEIGSSTFSNSNVPMDKRPREGRNVYNG